VTRNARLRTDNGGHWSLFACAVPRSSASCIRESPATIPVRLSARPRGSRSIGNDPRLEHELALIDVAAGLSFLRSHGFKNIVLLGNSGGASLYAFYVQQSSLDGNRRLARTPGGRPTNLDTLTMPEIDGFVFVAPHPGQGVLLMGCIDPSVVDERDPLSVDPALDALDSRNGFAEPPAPAKYAPEFLKRYRAAQRARVEKSMASRQIAARMDARKKDWAAKAAASAHMRRS
jgi:hypothetical protein